MSVSSTQMVNIPNEQPIQLQQPLNTAMLFQDVDRLNRLQNLNMPELYTPEIVRGVIHTDRALDFHDTMMETSPFQIRDLVEMQIQEWVAPDHATDYTSVLEGGAINVVPIIQNFQMVNYNHLELLPIPRPEIANLDLEHLNQCFLHVHHLFDHLGKWSLNHDTFFNEFVVHNNSKLDQIWNSLSEVVFRNDRNSKLLENHLRLLMTQFESFATNWCFRNLNEFKLKIQSIRRDCETEHGRVNNGFTSCTISINKISQDMLTLSKLVNDVKKDKDRQVTKESLSSQENINEIYTHYIDLKEKLRQQSEIVNAISVVVATEHSTKLNSHQSDMAQIIASIQEQSVCIKTLQTQVEQIKRHPAFENIDVSTFVTNAETSITMMGQIGTLDMRVQALEQSYQDNRSTLQNLIDISGTPVGISPDVNKQLEDLWQTISESEDHEKLLKLQDRVSRHSRYIERIENSLKEHLDTHLVKINHSEAITSNENITPAIQVATSTTTLPLFIQQLDGDYTNEVDRHIALYRNRHLSNSIPVVVTEIKDTPIKEKFLQYIGWNFSSTYIWWKGRKRI